MMENGVLLKGECCWVRNLVKKKKKKNRGQKPISKLEWTILWSYDQKSWTINVFVALIVRIKKGLTAFNYNIIGIKL